MTNQVWRTPGNRDELMRWRMRMADKFLHYREGFEWHRSQRTEIDYNNRAIPQPATAKQQRQNQVYMPTLGVQQTWQYVYRDDAGNPIPPRRGRKGSSSAPRRFRIDDIHSISQLLGGNNSDDKSGVNERRLDAFRNLRALKNYFASLPDADMFRYRRCLGWGGNGLAAAFDVLDVHGSRVRGIVVKSLFSGDLDAMDEEAEMLNLYAKCEHIVQLLYTDRLGLIDESGMRLTGPRAGRRAQDSPAHSPDDLDEGPMDLDRGCSGPATLILEMVENGDLSDFICKVRDHEENVPNRVLWSMFLCLSRMCIAMAYPASRFENFHRLPGPVTEWPPDDVKVKPLRTVHFDFDPKNVFLGEIGAGANPFEHLLGPMLKLGDFGLATRVLDNQPDFYYERFRQYAKLCFFAPEQFCEDWDFIDYDKGGAVSDHRIAGNYDVHTNIWCVGLIMETLITQCYPKIPPTPQETDMLPPPGREKYWTYGAHLLGPEYAHVDTDLLAMVVRCQAHFPDERLSLDDLSGTCYVKLKQQKGWAPYPGESDDEILDWLHRIMHEPPEDEDEAGADDDSPNGNGNGNGPSIQVGQQQPPPVFQWRNPTFTPRETRLRRDREEREAARRRATAEGGGAGPGPATMSFRHQVPQGGYGGPGLDVSGDVIMVDAPPFGHAWITRG
ncbi:kinase-like protein [Xylariaceae sp. FL0594]|nr:kinase-like protein [Xylariaceae sp. FL0594]